MKGCVFLGGDGRGTEKHEGGRGTYKGGRKSMGEGPGSILPVSEAFRCHGANLLPFTKFIGSGLFIK